MELVRLVLAGDRGAEVRFSRRLRPVIRHRVARVLLRFAGRSTSRDLVSEREDLTQQVFEILFERGSATLREWDPARGRSLDNYVAWLAERRAHDYLESGRTNPWREQLVADGEAGVDVEPAEDDDSPEQWAMNKELAARVFERLRASLSELGLVMFSYLFADPRDTDDICATLRMTPAAVHKWRQRIEKMIEDIARDLGSD